jgi:hypothetical protein
MRPLVRALTALTQRPTRRDAVKTNKKEKRVDKT